MSPRNLSLCVVVTVLAAIGHGCKNKCDLAPCQTQPSSTSAQNQAGPSTDHLVVYLDTSASMAGYLSPNSSTGFAASPDGNTIFSRTLLHLRDVVANGPEVVVRSVDVEVSPPSFGDLDISVSALNRKKFSGSETNLAGAIKMFSQPLDKNAESQAPPKFHIIVTDGVQSSKKSSTGNSCDRGSDPTCVKRQLGSLIESGWGGAVIGMKSEFSGKVYSEISGLPVPYVSGRDPAKYRPFFLYVFSPDRAALNKLVDSLRERLAPLGREDAFRELALTSNYSTGVPEIVVSTDKASKLVKARVDRKKDGTMPTIRVEAHQDTAKAGRQQVTVDIRPKWSGHALAGGSPDEIASMLKWELIPTSPLKAGDRYPDLELVKQQAAGGAANLVFETGWEPGGGDRRCRTYKLVGKLNTQKAALPWVGGWTTQIDTTAEAANKTLLLESALEGLWKNSAMENSPIAEICIVVEEK